MSRARSERAAASVRACEHAWKNLQCTCMREAEGKSQSVYKAPAGVARGRALSVRRERKGNGLTAKRPPSVLPSQAGNRDS